jgi:4-amino-4-deoxy-L-arabinose transferase-like glycosyltransferase
MKLPLVFRQIDQRLPGRMGLLTLLIAMGILMLAAYLRLFQLGDIPRGLSWDETSYAYNAYSLQLTGKDEWGVALPLFLRAFGEYKPALFSYLLIPFLALLGSAPFVVRLPTALMGISCVLAIGFIGWEITRSRTFALLCMAVLAIMPWHIHYSRAAIDPIIGFTFLLWGVALALRRTRFSQYGGGVCLVLSMYTYNAERAFVPVGFALLVLLAIVDKQWRVHWKKLVIPGTAILLGGVGLVASSFFYPLNSRAQTVLILPNDSYARQVADIASHSAVVGFPNIELLNNSAIAIIEDVSKHYLLHWSPNFLFFDGNLTPRHGFSRYGNLLLVTLPFLLYGLFVAIHKPRKLSWIMLGWAILAPLPAAFTKDVPHSGRDLMVLLPIVYFTALGIQELVVIRPRVWLRLIVAGVIATVFSMNLLMYWRDYQLYFPEESEMAWQGNMFTLTNYLKDAEKLPYSRIYLADDTAYTYTFLAWYWKLDPVAWQQQQGNHRELQNIIIDQISSAKLGCLLQEKNVLIVAPVRMEDTRMTNPNKTLNVRDRFQTGVAFSYIYDTNNLDRANWQAIRQTCQSAQ